jgi:Tfp pilus assembly protein PilO
LEQARKNVDEAEARFIRGDNPTLASVELQTIVETAARKSGLALNQRSVSPARRKDDFFNEITMTIAVEGTPSQISSFLAEIRGAPKVVNIRSAQMAPTEVMQEAPPKGDFKKMLRANLTIFAQLPIPVRKNG